MNKTLLGINLLVPDGDKNKQHKMRIKKLTLKLVKESKYSPTKMTEIDYENVTETQKLY